MDLLTLSIAGLLLMVLASTNWATVRGNLSAAWQGVSGAASGAGSLVRSQWTWAVILLSAGVLLGAGGRGLLNVDWREWVKLPDVVAPVEPVVPAKPTKVTYVHEKDQGGVPSGVRVALDKLNRQGIVATEFEDDTTNANQQVPAQYKIAKAEADKAGTPVLVVQSGDVVLRVVKVKTEAEVMEAAK
jgi:hypothetical protein